MRVLIFLLLSLITLPCAALEFSSTQDKKILIELFTSEGCSSCPPADRWLSQFTQDKRLWKSIFPLSFHVDYWDRLGWKDKFASAHFTQRQYNYKRQNRIRSIYTPGFVTNGKEWRAWFRRGALPTGVDGKGRLIGQYKDNVLSVKYTNPQRGKISLNVAVLGLNIVNKIGDGENEGKTLRHNFVVLSHMTKDLVMKNDSITWQAATDLSVPAPQKALVIWVSDDQGNPLQMAGTNL